MRLTLRDNTRSLQAFTQSKPSRRDETLNIYISFPSLGPVLPFANVCSTLYFMYTIIYVLFPSEPANRTSSNDFTLSLCWSCVPCASCLFTARYIAGFSSREFSAIDTSHIVYTFPSSIAEQCNLVVRENVPNLYLPMTHVFDCDDYHR